MSLQDLGSIGNLIGAIAVMKQRGALLWWERYSGALAEEFRRFVEQEQRGEA